MASAALLPRLLLLTLVMSLVAVAAGGDNSTAASKFAPSMAGVAASTSYEDPSLPSTVRYTYSFPTRPSPGRVFLRLFFYPAAYGDRGAGNAFFGVMAGGVTLLHDFNASQTTLALDQAYLVPEFSLNVSGSIDVTFAPSSSSAGSSNGYYAFVNGIEIVPMPGDMVMKPMPTFANGGLPDPMPICADTAF
ncbi:unnamed protein product [Miscanthus lutarioriparius]|uniref:Uncharacterized protein n=1 Tax=Miscanthus lutarioriparius TaxID=422564 RepID=A0A811SMU8_9POAL|nr:unnamed protein product [Miscanthus lutarioriparius]